MPIGDERSAAFAVMLSLVDRSNINHLWVTCHARIVINADSKVDLAAKTRARDRALRSRRPVINCMLTGTETGFELLVSSK